MWTSAGRRSTAPFPLSLCTTFAQGKSRDCTGGLFHALRPGGLYVECDYMVDTQSEEDYYFAENARLRAEQGISADAFYHFDTPCTVANQISLLQNAGFTAVEQVFRMGNTTMLSALRPV